MSNKNLKKKHSLAHSKSTKNYKILRGYIKYNFINYFFKKNYILLSNKSFNKLLLEEFFSSTILISWNNLFYKKDY